MATTDSTDPSSWSSFAWDHRDAAINVLTVVAPPAAILVRQGKDDLDGRQFLLSLALYCSFFLYIPAVLHAYWLLAIREEGWEHWRMEKKSQAETAWKTYLGPYVDPIVLRLTSFLDKITTFAHDLMRKAKEVIEEAKKAYGDGTVMQWMGGYIKYAVEKARLFSSVDFKEGVKDYAAPFPRLQAIITYFEQRITILLQNIVKIISNIKEKIFPSSTKIMEVSRVPDTSDMQNGLPSVVAPPSKSHRGKKDRSNGHNP